MKKWEKDGKKWGFKKMYVKVKNYKLKLEATSKLTFNQTQSFFTCMFAQPSIPNQQLNLAHSFCSIMTTNVYSSSSSTIFISFMKLKIKYIFYSIIINNNN